MSPLRAAASQARRLVLLGCALALGACSLPSTAVPAPSGSAGSSSSASSSPASSPVAEVAEVVTAYARALATGVGVDDVVAPGASSLATRLRERAAVAARVGVENLALAPDPATLAVDGGSAKVTAAGSFRVRGAPPGTTPFTVDLVLVRSGTRWRVRDDRGAQTLPLPWEMAGAVRLDGDGVVVIGNADRAVLGDYLQMAGGAWSATRGLWPRRPAGSPVVLVPSTTEQFARLTRRADAGAVAAVTVGSVVAGRPARGDVVVVNPAGQGRLTAEGRRTVLRHELVHLAIRGTTTRAVPAWLSEGYATQGSWGGAVPAQLRARAHAWTPAQRAPLDAPSDEQIRSPQEATRAYDLAALLVDDLVHRHGRDAVVAFYEALAAGATREDAARRHLGEEFTTSLACWRESLARLA